MSGLSPIAQGSKAKKKPKAADDSAKSGRGLSPIAQDSKAKMKVNTTSDNSDKIGASGVYIESKHWQHRWQHVTSSPAFSLEYLVSISKMELSDTVQLMLKNETPFLVRRHLRVRVSFVVCGPTADAAASPRCRTHSKRAIFGTI